MLKSIYCNEWNVYILLLSINAILAETTWVADSAAHGVAFLKEELHKPGCYEPTGAGDADGLAMAGSAVCDAAVQTHVLQFSGVRPG
jgi:hypothetical protein